MTIGVALCPEGCGDSAGDGGLLEDCLVSLFVRLCCKSALICFIARVCLCPDDALMILYPQNGIRGYLSASWMRHQLPAMHNLTIVG